MPKHHSIDHKDEEAMRYGSGRQQTAYVLGVKSVGARGTHGYALGHVATLLICSRVRRRGSAS